MGSPVSAVIANLSLESFKEQAVTSSPYKLRIWKPYIHYTITISSRGGEEGFQEHSSHQQLFKKLMI